MDNNLIPDQIIAYFDSPAAAPLSEDLLFSEKASGKWIQIGKH